jgi:hypothetical protein
MRYAGSRAVRWGWTLIEKVLVIAIIAVLVALAMPSLGRVRASALELRTLSYLHGHGVVLATYGADWKDSFPAFFDPGETPPHHLTRADRRTEQYPAYFLAHLAWHIALADHCYGGSMVQFYPAEQTAADGLLDGAPFLMSCTVFASPAFWNYDTRSGPSQWGATRQADVRHPSKKVILLSAYHLTELSGRPFSLVAPAPLLAGDGGARRAKVADYIPGMPNGEGDYAGAAHFGDFFVGLHTRDGIYGRDLR